MGTDFLVSPVVGQEIMFFKLKEGRFRIDIRKKFFMEKVVKHRHRLLTEVVDAHSWRHSRSDWMQL